jgi:ankyrin repeat protein
VPSNITGLMNASKSNRIEKVMQAIDAGIDINIVDKSGMTALHYAAQNGHQHLAMRLIDLGASVLITNVLLQPIRTNRSHNTLLINVACL